MDQSHLSSVLTICSEVTSFHLSTETCQSQLWNPLLLILIFCGQDSYDDGFVFNQLEHLNLCVCMPEKSKILGQLLKDSPNLRVLNIFKVQVCFIHKLFLVTLFGFNLILLLGLRVM